MKTGLLSRRRFLSVCAVAGTYAALPWAAALASAPLHRWNGILLGAEVSLTLAHHDKQVADALFKQCVAEIKRLENIFTLYDSYSELSRLNANGVLRDPSPEMVDILEKSRAYHALTNGAFDVTIKALEDGKSLDLVGMDNVQLHAREICLEKPGMAITLNGIAQGYITDRITELLKTEGLNNVLVELGEKRALGMHPDGRSWFLAVEGLDKPVSLVDKALATSASHSPNTGKPHIFMPANGEPAQKHNFVSVIADTATMADALSTGFMSFRADEINALKRHMPELFNVYIG